MKNLLNLLLVCVLTTSVAFACPPDGDGAKKASTDAAVQTDVQFASLDLKVVGMTCGGCENKVKAILSSMDGIVETKKVCSESDKASLTFDPAVISQDDIIKTLGEKSGYAVTMVKSAGMTEGAVKEACSKECAKTCCANKSAKGKASCASKAKAKSCAKTKAAGDTKLEKE